MFRLTPVGLINAELISQNAQYFDVDNPTEYSRLSHFAWLRTEVKKYMWDSGRLKGQTGTRVKVRRVTR